MVDACAAGVAFCPYPPPSPFPMSVAPDLEPVIPPVGDVDTSPPVGCEPVREREVGVSASLLTKRVDEARPRLAHDDRGIDLDLRGARIGDQDPALVVEPDPDGQAEVADGIAPVHHADPVAGGIEDL